MRHKAGEILFQEGGAVSTNELSFIKRQDRAKGQLMMTFRADMEFEGDGAMEPTGEPDLNYMA